MLAKNKINFIIVTKITRIIYEIKFLWFISLLRGLLLCKIQEFNRIFISKATKKTFLHRYLFYISAKVQKYIRFNIGYKHCFYSWTQHFCLDIFYSKNNIFKNFKWNILKTLWVFKITHSSYRVKVLDISYSFKIISNNLLISIKELGNFYKLCEIQIFTKLFIY